MLEDKLHPARVAEEPSTGRESREGRIRATWGGARAPVGTREREEPREREIHRRPDARREIRWHWSEQKERRLRGGRSHVPPGLPGKKAKAEEKGIRASGWPCEPCAATSAGRNRCRRGRFASPLLGSVRARGRNAPNSGMGAWPRANKNGVRGENLGAQPNFGALLEHVFLA
jgi:hypothetical protein